MTNLGAFLAGRMGQPQRHRLLQGHPSMPRMRYAAPPLALDGALTPYGVRGLRGELSFDRASIEQRIAQLQKSLSGPPPRTVPEDVWRDRRAALEQAIETSRKRLAAPDPSEAPFIEIDRERDLLVGIIPHTQCNPRVEGCGFCTFPHDAPDNALRADTVEAVALEAQRLVSDPALRGRRVHALYFGGGTANLAKPDALKGLFDDLAKHLDLSSAEVSLEGVPVYFTTWFFAHLKMLASLPVERRRISMGIQTFDAAQITSMGRQAFGDHRTVTKLVKRCAQMDIGTSGDLLFNLPGQTLKQMEDDVDRAIESGLDQICLYHLVLHEGLGTPWSKDPQKLAAVPDNETACGHWMALRARLLRAGFAATTVTNFERVEIAGGPRAFRYERASFTPERTDAVGLGPMSISTFVDRGQRRAVKLLRRKSLAHVPWQGDDLYFPYEGDDYRLLFLTRSFARGELSAAAYAEWSGSALEHDFPGTLAAVGAEDLVEHHGDAIALTPRGVFFSDSVMATFAAECGAGAAGAGVHTSDALATPTRLGTYGGMG